MYNDYNRYTFFPGHLHWFYDSQEFMIVAYYNPDPVYSNSYDFKLNIVQSSIVTKYEIKPNYIINRIENTIRIYNPEMCTIGEIQDIQNAYKDQYGKELDLIVRKEDIDMMPVE